MNYLPSRIISASWLGLLACIFVSAISTTLSDKGMQPLFTSFNVIALFVGAASGFFYEYKILLLPAAELNLFIVRMIAGLWPASIGFLWVMGIVSSTPINIILSVIIVITAFITGWIYTYRLFLKPTVIYKKEFPDFLQRIISTFLFGITAYSLGYLFFKNTIIVNYYVLCLGAFFGYVYGYRILLLPTSLRGTVKAAMLGFIGGSYAAFFVAIIFALSVLLSTPEIVNASYLDKMQMMGKVFLIIIGFFPIAGLIASVVGIIVSLALYLVSRLFILTRPPFK